MGLTAAPPARDALKRRAEVAVSTEYVATWTLLGGGVGVRPFLNELKWVGGAFEPNKTNVTIYSMQHLPLVFVESTSAGRLFCTIGWSVG